MNKAKTIEGAARTLAVRAETVGLALVAARALVAGVAHAEAVAVAGAVPAAVGARAVCNGKVRRSGDCTGEAARGTENRYIGSSDS